MVSFLAKRTLDSFVGRRQALEELRGLGGAALLLTQQGEGFAAAGEVEVVLGKSRFADRQGAQEEPLVVRRVTAVVGDARREVPGSSQPWASCLSRVTRSS